MAPPTSWRGSLSPPGSPIGRWVIRYHGLAGDHDLRSFHAAATWTFSEGERRLRRVRYKEPPEGIFFGSGTGQECVSSPAADEVSGRRQMGIKRERRCRPSRRAAARHATPISGPPAHGRAFAAPACRLRAYRRLAGHNRAQNLVALFEADPSQRLKQFVPDLRCDAGAVVAHQHLDRIAETVRARAPALV
jgi:hypothetical protein